MKVKQADLKIISCLRQDARMRLTDMSKATRIPVSSIFDRMKMHEGGLIKKHTALVSFDRLGYHAKALIVFSASREDRQKLYDTLQKNSNVNSLYKINNGWDCMAEVVFRGIKEVEEFVEQVEKQVNLKDKKIFYILDDIKKEAFLSNPKTEGWMR